MFPYSAFVVPTYGRQYSAAVDRGILMVDAGGQRQDNEEFLGLEGIAAQIGPVLVSGSSPGSLRRAREQHQTAFPSGLLELGKGSDSNGSQCVPQFNVKTLSDGWCGKNGTTECPGFCQGFVRRLLRSCEHRAAIPRGSRLLSDGTCRR